MLCDVTFLKTLLSFRVDHLGDATLQQVEPYIQNPELTVESVKKVSVAAGELCAWAHAVYTVAVQRRSERAGAEKSPPASPCTTGPPSSQQSPVSVTSISLELE